MFQYVSMSDGIVLANNTGYIGFGEDPNQKFSRCSLADVPVSRSVQVDPIFIDFPDLYTIYKLTRKANKTHP